MGRFVTLDVEENHKSKNDSADKPACLKVVGVGGGGCNAVESMITRGLKGVEYVAINTDAQVLRLSNAHHVCQVGNHEARGLGAGADPKVGKNAVEDDKQKIEQVLAGSDMVFITAGMGGGTGTGGAPTVAQIARSLGALVVGIVTKPFKWEGKKRMLNAEKGIDELKKYVDSLIVIPNSELSKVYDKSSKASEVFNKPNEVLYEATRGIADIITITGIINVDFADVKTVMKESGDAMMGSGTARGEERAVEAAKQAISSPLLKDINIQGAKDILLNVTGSDNLTMEEIEKGNEVIYQAAGDEANVIFGWVNKEEMGDAVTYTVIATGFGEKYSEEEDDEPRAYQAPKQRKEQFFEEEKVAEEEVKPTSKAGNKKEKTEVVFDDKTYDENKEDVNYDIPTWARYKKMEDEILSAGFKPKFDNPDDLEENNEAEDEDAKNFNTSEYLRQIAE